MPDKSAFSAIVVCVVLCLSAGTLVAGENCKPVNVNVGAAILPFPLDCEFQGFIYWGCLDTPINGTLNGNWRFYVPEYNNVDVVLDPMPSFPVPGHPGFLVGWGVSAWQTQKGDVWTRDSFAIDLEDLEDPDLPFVQTSVVVGGTGVYEGATGSFGFVGDMTEGILRGEICWPED